MNVNALSDLVCPAAAERTGCNGHLELCTEFVQPLFQEDDQVEVLEALLRCQECQAEYPVICGVLILVPALKTYFAEHYSEIMSAIPPRSISLPMLSYIQTRGYDLHDAGYTSYSWDSPIGLSNYISAHYDGLGTNAGEPRALSEFITAYKQQDFYTEIIDLSKPHLSRGSRVLDIGCNVGGFCWRFSQHSQSVYGIDVSYRSVLTARRILMGYPDKLSNYRLYREGLAYEKRNLAIDPQGSVEMIVATSQNLPFRKCSFDFINCVNVLDLVTDPKRLLDEVCRVLDAGSGILLLADPYYWRRDRSEIDTWIGVEEGRPSAKALKDILGAKCDLLDERDDLIWVLHVNARYYQIWLEHCVVYKKRP